MLHLVKWEPCLNQCYVDFIGNHIFGVDHTSYVLLVKKVFNMYNNTFKIKLLNKKRQEWDAFISPLILWISGSFLLLIINYIYLFTVSRTSSVCERLFCIWMINKKRTWQLQVLFSFFILSEINSIIRSLLEILHIFYFFCSIYLLCFFAIIYVHLIFNIFVIFK